VPRRGLSTSSSSCSPFAATVAATSPINSLVGSTTSLKMDGIGPYKRLVPPPLLSLSQPHHEQQEPEQALKAKTSSSTQQDETLRRLQRMIAQLEGENLRCGNK